MVEEIPKKMKQASLMSFLTRKKPIVKPPTPPAEESNKPPLKELQPPIETTITPDTTVDDFKGSQELGLNLREENSNLKKKETPSKLQKEHYRDPTSSPAHLNGSFDDSFNSIASSPVKGRRKRINYSELSDEDEDEEDGVVKPRKKKRSFAWDDGDDEDFDMDSDVKNSDNDDDDDDEFTDDRNSTKEELENLYDNTKIESEEEIEKDDFVEPLRKTPNSSKKGSKISSILSGRQKSPLKSNSLSAQKKFSKENEERYQWLITVKDADGHLETDPNYDPRTLYIPPSAWAKFTAFEKQYWEIKSKMWDTVVFFKKGKFFELYEKDADIAHSKFDLKLAGTGRANMRLAGVPEMSFDYWAKRFITAGYKVAKVDQKESMLAKEIRGKNGAQDAKESKVIQRELEYVLTCGTLMDENLLNDEMSKYCLSIKENIDWENSSKKIGLCFVDVSTGNFYLLEFDDDLECSKLETLLSQINPMEVLVPKNELDTLTLRVLKFNSHPNASFNFIKPEAEFWDHEKTVDELSKFNETHDLKTPPVLQSYYQHDKFLAFSAFGAVFWYLRTLKLDSNIISMGNFKEYNPFDKNLLGSSMRLDGITLQNLEVFNNSFDQSDRGTLFRILNRGVTAFGKRVFKNWVIHPLLNKHAIDERLDSVELLLNDGDLKYIIESKLKRVVDIERMLTRIHSKSLRAKDFVKVIDSFQVISELVNDINRYGIENLRGLLRSLINSFPIAEMNDLLVTWNDKFDRDAAINEDLIVPKEGVDAEFDESNAKIIGVENELNAYLKEYRKKYKSNEICYKDSGKEIYLIEVPIKLANKIPRDWQQMAATSKCKRYWSPEVKSLVKKLMELRELHKIICLNLKDKIYENFDKSYEKCMKVVTSIGKIDCLISLTRASESLGYPICRPEIVESDNSFIDYKQLRHPCFMPGSGILTTKDFIPNDIELGIDNKNNIGLLTGANAAGKSTLLRMSCIATIMAQIGCFLPAESARLSPVDAIMTRLGANDNIMQGKSTFYVELLETKKMLDNATPKSLIILDELGRGGSSSDGFAIAEAVLHHFATHIQAIGFFATHYANLGQSFLNHPKIIPLRMAILVDSDSKKITFLYKLEKGQSNGSFGMHVATMCGIPKDIVQNAEIAAKKWEHTSKLDKINDTKAGVIPLGVESDFSWWSQNKHIISCFGQEVEKEAMRSIFTMIDGL